MVEAPKWEFWSTRESIENDIPSITAIIESFLAVCVVGWIATHYQTYLPLLISTAAAPLVLLRSDPSAALGVKWFSLWEKRLFSKEVTEEITWLSWLIALLGLLLPVLIIYFVTYHFFADFDGWTGFGYGFLIGWLSRAVVAAEVTIATGLGSPRPATALLELGSAVGAAVTMTGEVTTSVITGLLVGVSVPLIVTIHLMWGRWPVQQIMEAAKRGEKFETQRAMLKISEEIDSKLYSNMITNVLSSPGHVGYAGGVFLVSLVIRITATLRHFSAGIRSLPRNFRRLVFCTSPKQTPELLPGLIPAETKYTLPSMWLEFTARIDRSKGWPSHIAISLVYLPIMLFWFFPGWLYRVTLKGTAWLWWPLVILGRPPKLAKNPDWFRVQVMEARWSRNMRLISYVSIITFVGFSLWQTLREGHIPENPFLNVVGYAFSIEWSSKPWQLLGFAGSLLSIAIVYLVDWAYRKYRVAVDTADASLAEEALKQFEWIERVSRLRLMLFIAYCAIVGFHALLVLNARECWFAPTSTVQAWAHSLYGERTPNRECMRPPSPAN